MSRLIITCTVDDLKTIDAKAEKEGTSREVVALGALRAGLEDTTTKSEVRHLGAKAKKKEAVDG